MINSLYDLHDTPEKLDHYSKKHTVVPSLAWGVGANTGVWHEEALSKNGFLAYRYARDILNGPFKMGEPAIAKDPHNSFNYAQNILNGPFKLGEPAIAKKNGSRSLAYARGILDGPFKLGEPAMAKNAELAFGYAVYVLDMPFKLGEPAIAKDPYYAEVYNDIFKTNI